MVITLNSILDIVEENSNWNKILKDGEIRICHFPMFPPDHQDRPAIIIRYPGVPPYIIAIAHIEPDDDNWKNHEENVFVDDWKQESLKKPSYANTNKLYTPNQIRIGSHKAYLTQHDYNRSVKPIHKRLENNRMDELFEFLGLDFMVDTLSEYVTA